MSAVVRAFILWAVKRAGRDRWYRQPVVTFDDKFLFARFCFAWQDEFILKDGTHLHRPPWWRPFNLLLHWWKPDIEAESFHDHPRWSVTICLRGRIIEKTPWHSRELRPGSIVIRSRKAIHAFEVPHGFSGKTWTLFIVGRRNHRQSTYVITPR